jgi:hypothetical protein
MAGKPVEGWTAERHDILVQRTKGVRTTMESYRVTACPEFEE